MELVIVKPGALLRISGGRLRISEPEREQDRFISFGDLTQITLDRRCQLSSAVLYSALERGIEVVLTGRGGAPVGRLWSQRFGSISTIRRNQLEWSREASASEWVVDLLQRKIKGQRLLLFSLRGRSQASESFLEHADQKLARAVSKISSRTRGVPEVNYDLWRSSEGAASRAYFQALSQALPGAWAFTERSQHPAKDAFNALLNYGYGIIYQRIEGCMLTAGLDPSIGVFHADGYRRPSLVFDLIEPYRSWIDFTCVELVLAKALAPDDFQPSGEADSGVWLSQSGRRILVQAVVDYYSEIIDRDGQSRTRLNHLQAECHSLAQHLLKWQKK